MAVSALQCLEQVLGSKGTDSRIPVIVLLGTSLERSFENLLCRVGQADLGRLVVFTSQKQLTDWPSYIRLVQVNGDELLQADGCLCCSMRSELAASLSRLFLSVLRREQPSVAAVIIVTGAANADPLVQTLKHAPFLGQRYRLAACLPLTGA